MKLRRGQLARAAHHTRPHSSGPVITMPNIPDTPPKPPVLDAQHRAELIALGCVEPGTEQWIELEEFA